MGFFPKNAGSRLFNAGFAISDEDSKLIDIAEELERDEENSDGVASDFTDVGCADVVHLLHSLPRKGNQTELHAIVKTFEVLGISLQGLLEEARRKEQLTSDRLLALDQEIQRLNEELEQRREETNMLNLGLEELHKLEESLEKMVELEAQDQEFADDYTSSQSNKKFDSTSNTKSARESNDTQKSKSPSSAAATSQAAEDASEAEPVALGDAYVLQGEDLIETQKIIDLDRKPKTSMSEKIREKTVRKRRTKVGKKSGSKSVEA